MTRTWRRAPASRAGAALLAAALATSAVVYAGLRTEHGSGPDSRRTQATKPVTEAAALAQAAHTGQRVEVTAARTARTTTWAQPDGVMVKQLYSSPIRAKVDGEWRKIDRDLHRTKAGWEPKATNTRMVFSAGSTKDAGSRASRATARRVSLVKQAATEDTGTPLITLHVEDHDIQLTWPGPVPAPIIDGNRALYPEIFPGGDLVLMADDDGFGQLIVLKNRQAASDPHVQQLVYGLHSASLTFRLSPVSGIVSALSAYGDEVAVSSTPFMWDSSGSPAVTDGTTGASAQPTAPETPSPSDSVVFSPSDSASPTEEGPIESDEQSDTDVEVLPSATDGSAPPLSESPLPSVPSEPTPEPSRTGDASTFSLPGLDGPSPDSRGDLVDVSLAAGTWSLTPSQDFLADPATVYPVFIDPPFKRPSINWTTAYDRHPHATFYNGKGFNKGGTHEARVGFESDTWGTSRSFFNFPFDKDLKGTKIIKAKLRLLETYAWSCSARSMSVHLTGPIDGHTNWKNAPRLHDGNKLATRTFAHGWKTSCGDEYEEFIVTAGAQQAANDGDDTITFGLRARDEDSQYAWKKFQANGENPPMIEVFFNRKPVIVPNSLGLEPDARCTTTKPYVRMGPGTLTFSARATDKDANLTYIDFDLWPAHQLPTTGDLLGAAGKALVGGDKADALKNAFFSTSTLSNGTTYSWRVRAFDDRNTSSSYYPLKNACRFVYDATAPLPPKVTSTDFPNADADINGFGNSAEDALWSPIKFGTPGSFTVQARNSDVVRFEYGFNSPNYLFSKTKAAGTTTSITGKPPAAGPNVLYIRAIDSAGNPSEPTRYFFYVTPRDQADKPGDFTGDQLPDLMTVTEAGNLALYPSQSDGATTPKGTGDLDYAMSGAYRLNPAKDPAGDNLPPYSDPPAGHFKGALITHNGDIYGGDGLQDLVVRVGGKLWVYPGDGYGAVNIDRRHEILLPANAPDPANLTQIVSAGDATGDGRPDFFATATNGSNTELWAFVGYHGASIDMATRLGASGWQCCDIVTVQDVSGDGVTDLIYRGDTTGQLKLRKGIAEGAGVKLTSLGSGASSADGADSVYGSSGWTAASIPMLIGTPDANGDSIPDIWTVRSDGSVRFYTGSKTVLAGAGTEIVVPNAYWAKRIAIG
ncbi:DNRLRE domain-containing protein [Streptomyces sp. NPDC093094]|uniref:DNRLRE domain-containing protein n=1 Tax=Streptomyces sp. NPDC093094 TaxID=3366026 RepID=UPI0038028252